MNNVKTTEERNNEVMNTGYFITKDTAINLEYLAKLILNNRIIDENDK